MTYVIHEPVTDVPPATIPIAQPQERWTLAYKAAQTFKGCWVPITFANKSDARRLAESAKRCDRHRYDVTLRGDTVYLKAVGR